MEGKRKISVLFLGKNHASIMNSHVIGLRKLGVNCFAMNFDVIHNLYVNYDNVYRVYEKGYNQFATLKGCLKLLKAVFKSTHIHIISDFSVPSRFEKLLYWIVFNFFSRQHYITFTGSDIRDAESELERNPYFSYAYNNPNYEGRKFETKSNSDRLQSAYATRKAYPILTPETVPLINKDIFKHFSIIHHPSYNPVSKPMKKPGSGTIRIVHAPSSPVAKGTQFIVSAIEKIVSEKRYSIQFKLLQGLTNTQYLQELENCDILIDQIIWGWYGVASQQALEMGKVVVAYLSDDRLHLVEDCPIVNANVENLSETLENLLSNVSLIETLSQSSKRFYEKYHKPESVAKMIIDVYEKN